MSRACLGFVTSIVVAASCYCWLRIGNEQTEMVTVGQALGEYLLLFILC